MDLEHEKRITEIEARSKSNAHRLDAMEKRQDDQEKLINTVAVLASELETMKRDVKETKNDVKTLVNKPGQRWEVVIDKVITTVVAVIIGFILAKIGF